TSMKTAARRDSRVNAWIAADSFSLPRVSTITSTPSFCRIAKPTPFPAGTSTVTSKPTLLKKSRVGSTRSTKSTGVARFTFILLIRDGALGGGADELGVLADQHGLLTRLRRLPLRASSRMVRLG